MVNRLATEDRIQCEDRSFRRTKSRTRMVPMGLRDQCITDLLRLFSSCPLSDDLRVPAIVSAHAYRCIRDGMDDRDHNEAVRSLL
jgi:hypothetical protein